MIDGVGVRPDVEQQADDIGGREAADRVAVDGGALPRARHVEERVAVLAASVQLDEVEERLLERVLLGGRQLVLDLGEQEHQVDDDAERPVEVRQVPFAGGRLGQEAGAGADLAHGPAQHGHHVGERERRHGRVALGGAHAQVAAPHLELRLALAAPGLVAVVVLRLAAVPLRHHVAEELGEREQRAVRHRAERLEHGLLHLERVHPQPDAAAEVARVRVHGAAVPDVVRRLRVSGT